MLFLVVAIFGKKYGSFSPKIVGRIFVCENPFSSILSLKKERKKAPMATKLEQRTRLPLVFYKNYARLLRLT